MTDILATAGTGPDPDALAAAAVQGTATETDVAALLARLNAIEAELAAARAARGAAGQHAAVQTAHTLRDLIASHFSHGGKGDQATLGRLADDVVDATENAVKSGDTSVLRDLAGRMERALLRTGQRLTPGEPTPYDQALDFARVHIPEAADAIMGPQPSGAVAVTGGAPVNVIAGSVTG